MESPSSAGVSLKCAEESIFEGFHPKSQEELREPVWNSHREEQAMRNRYEVIQSGKSFASVHATTAEEAIHIACRMTGRSPEGCEVRRAVSASRASSGRRDGSRMIGGDAGQVELPAFGVKRTA